MTIALAALLYSVHPIGLPNGSRIRLAPDVGAAGPRLRPSRIALGSNGSLAAVIETPQGEQRLFVVRANGTSVTLPPLSEALLAGAFRTHVGVAHPIFPGAQLRDVALSPDGTPYVAVAFEFSGAYGGIEKKPFMWDGKEWQPVPLNWPRSYGANHSVAACGDLGRCIYNADFGNLFPDMDEAQKDPHYQEHHVVDVHDRLRENLGYGIATAARNSYVVGYDAHIRTVNPPAEHADLSYAVEWINGRRRRLGPGIAYGVNSSGVAVGDDERTLFEAGRPTVWSRDGQRRLSPLQGSAYGVADDGTIVGVIGNDAFMIGRGDHGVLQRFDTRLRDREWHVIAAYGVSRNGRVLALASRKTREPELVLLDPTPP